MVVEGAQKILRSYQPRNVSRGRVYAAQGRVTNLQQVERGVTAVVQGTKRYRVDLVVGADGAPRCTCPAFANDRECKHIAALAWTVTGGAANAAKGSAKVARPTSNLEFMASPSRSSQAADLDLLATRRPPSRKVAPTIGAVERSARPSQELPAVFSSSYSASAFLSRLALYVGAPIRHDVEAYSPLGDWWRSAPATASTDALRKHVLECAPELESVVETLRVWKAPPSPLPDGSGFTAFYEKLARLYDERSKDVRIGYGLPGPLDARHPGFTVSYLSKRRIFELREIPSNLLSGGRHLAILLPLDEPGQPLTFQGNAFADYGPADAWDVFALRAMILALHARTEAAVRELERDLDRPMWDHVLEHLVSRKGAPEAREWSFCLSANGRESYVVTALARTVTSSKPGRWKRERFEVLFDEDVLPVEREIARLALVVERGGRGARTESTFVLGTPHAHELLRRLAEHPRVFVGSHYNRPDPESDFPVEITVGQVTMSLERQRSGLLAPRFHVDGQPIPVSLDSLTGDRSSLFRAGVSARMIVSLEIPAALRSWLDMATRLGDALAFPSEAMPKLVTATQPLMTAGIVELPRAALGDELSYEPGAALRVEWKSTEEGVEAVIEVMIQVRPNAPFVAAGRGPNLFTFEHEGRRVYVERAMRHELTIAGDTLDQIDADLRWTEGVGRADRTEAALALAEWLDRNPLKLPIEVKVGRPPVLHSLANQKSKVIVRKIGAWLRLDGSLELGGAKVSLGEMLEAARHARRYIRVGDGSFLELSKEVIAKLKPVATAAALAPPNVATTGESAADDGSLVLHDAFGSLVSQVTELFGKVEAKGVDLLEYARRFEGRDRRVRVPALENGTLRDYQRDGVEWMLRLASWAPGCVLADDMGLGKTVQTAAVLKARSKLGPALIVAPASVSSNWVSELARFMPSLVVRWYNEDRMVAFGELGPRDVLIVSYNLLQRQSAAFRERHWATVVIDEAQYVKNILTQRSDAVRSLSRDFTIALTGTPLENHLGELFSIVDIAFPGLLGDEQTFRECFRRPIEAHRESERLAMLGSLLGPFLLRRTRSSVLQELPPREDITEHLEPSLQERKRYLALRRICEDSLTKRQNAETPAQLRIVLLAALTRLRQMACDVRLVDPTFEGPSTKIARTVELATQLAAEGNCALVFSQFTQFLDKVGSALTEAGLRVASLTGETPTTARRPLIDAFQAGEYDVFCVSLLAGGTGLNLTRASYVIHLDPWWNPAAEEQATSRAHRMGQTNPVTVYRLVARGTIEEAVLEMHADKRELASAVLEGKGNPKAITSAELLDLLRFGS